MRLICIRHLPTAYNQSQLLQGRRDIPISPPSSEDIIKISENKKVLKSLGPFKKVFVSSLQRTSMTAILYGVHEYIVDSLIDEFDFGIYEGEKRGMMLAEIGEKWEKDPASIVLGESISDFAWRVGKFAGKYSDYQKVLVFSHGCWIRALISLARHGDVREMNQIEVANNSIVDIIFDKKLYLH
jgi:broad specificity phosphatase PhoE